MTRIILLVLFLVVLSEGIGIWTLDKLHVESKGFSAPIGFAIFLCALQLGYYPAQLWNLSFTWILVVTIIAIVLGILLTVRKIKEVFKHLWSWNTLIVVACAGLFFYALSKCYIDLDFSDSATYLNYIAQNIQADHLNLFNPTNGLVGEEWDVLYLFQGYYHFAGSLCWLVNIPFYCIGSSVQISNLVITVWGLGLLYSILSSMLIINMVRYFKFHNPWFEFCVLIFALLFTNFFYWKVAFAFYGNTFRGFFVALLLYIIYRWFKEGNEQIKYVTMFAVGAGIACSSSFLFLSFEILYCLAAFLFRKQKVRSLFDMLTLIIPLVVYACAVVSRSHVWLAVLIFAVYTILCFLRYKKPLRRWITRTEDFFFDHAIAIFYVGIPVLVAIVSAGIFFFTKDLEDIYGYAHYFWNFREIDMVKDYLFLYSGWLDNILNVVRWGGVVLVILNAKSQEDQWMKSLYILMLVFFLDPLCTIALSKTVTGIVYYRSFEILFNPFTEIVLLYAIYKLLEWQTLWQWVLELLLVAAVVVGQVGSYIGMEDGLYSFYVKGGKDVDSLYKMEEDEVQANLFLQEYDASHPQEGQTVLVSQSGGTRTFLPSSYQLFTPRDYFYWMFRIDDNFYEITKRHYAWLDPVETDYSVTCDDLKNYQTDYILLQYWENPEFDEASDACSVTIYTGSKYKVKEVIK